MKLPRPITITDFTLKQWTFESVEAFKAFIKSQVDFWSQRNGIAPQNPTANQYIQRCGHFQTVLNQITSWEPEIETWEPTLLDSNFGSLVSNYLGGSWLWSGHPFVEKWLELNDTSANIADAFFEAIVQKTTSRFAQGMDFVQGYLIAYEYINQGKTEINKRRNSENKSLSNLRDQLVDKQHTLIGKVDAFEEGVTGWKNKTESDYSDWFGKQVTHLENAVLAHSKNFHEQFANWTNKHTELENLFREKLRFDSAAKYWGEKVSTFRTQGYCWGAALLIFLVAGIALFSIFFLGWLSGQPTGLGLQSIEGILIYATVLSSYAFLIKSLSKMTFSSFHLMRDAEEREQLTHLYLSLREGKDDDPESRKIVLQALFSRSDSGLLAGDHSPTMPTVQDAIKIIKP
jgi:hypothetical protein